MWYPSQPDWFKFPRDLIALLPARQTPWLAAALIVGRQINRRRASLPKDLKKVYPPDLPDFALSVQRLALDIEVGRGELAFEDMLRPTDKFPVLTSVTNTSELS